MLNKIIEILPPPKLERIVWYNLVERLGQFITEKERIEYEQIIDLDFIKENCRNWKDYLSSKIEQNKVILLGETHTLELVEKNAVTEFLYQAKDGGVTDIGLEIRGECQETFDRFLISGKFSENDNPENYEKIHEYQELRSQFYKKESDVEINRILMDLRKLTKSLYGNFLFDHLIYEYYSIIKKARELDLKIKCLDINPNYFQEESQLAVAAIIDFYTKKIRGWVLSKHLDASLTIEALSKALATNPKPKYHHSDQGVQYCDYDYVGILKENEIKISMSDKGNPYQNNITESFFKTLKYNEVYLNEYESYEEALSNIENFIEVVYHKKRLHSSLGYLPPEEFEQKLFNEKSRNLETNLINFNKQSISLTSAKSC